MAPMFEIQATDEFWSVVEECLQEFHHLSPDDAVEKGRALRRQIKTPPAGIIGEIIYYDEPFDVACELACRPLDLAQYRTQYDAILSRQNW